jgi:hypothetical protein
MDEGGATAWQASVLPDLTDEEGDCLGYGRDPDAPLRRALIGASRSCQAVFNVRQRADFEMVLLWQRGDPWEVALAPLAAVPVDASAGAALVLVVRPPELLGRLLLLRAGSGSGQPSRAAL